MKSIKLLAGIAVSAVGLTTAVAMGVVNQSQNNGLLETKAEIVDFSTKTMTRRVWLVDNDPNWWQADANRRIYVYAFQKTETSHNETVVATKLISDYSGGLFYADVTFTGAGDNIGVIARWGDVNGVYDWGNNNQTGTMSLASLGNKAYDVINLESGTWYDYGENRNSRNANIGTAGLLGNEQMSTLLQTYQTCDGSYTTGYNAYPQFNANFYAPNSGLTTTTEFNDYDYDEYVAAGKNYDGLTQKTKTTIAEKAAQLQYMYNTYGWTVA